MSSKLRVLVRVAGAAAVLLAVCVNAPSWGQSPRQLIAQQVPAALKILRAYHDPNPVPCRRTLHVVYWTPADREPAPKYRERLSRVLLDVQGFYRTEMQRLGLGERTFQLASEADGLLKLHLVRGAKPYERYDVDSGGEIRTECLPTLEAAGIDAGRETIAIFCNMSNWDEKAGTMRQNGPYYAGGGLRSGTAWQVDSPLLDAALIAKKEPLLTDGQYGRISVGKYNSIFVGGVCHELGHAFGLPHNSERPEERAAFGTALMGSGNRTYGDDRRGEGRGSFLTLAEGLRLAGQPLFSGSEKGIDLPPNVKLSDIAVERASDKKSFTFSATVSSDPPAYAVVGYLDPAGGSDYDAPTITAVPDERGRFSLRCAALRSGKAAALRIVVCQANGGRIGDQALSLPYEVAPDGVVDLSAIQAKLKLAPLAAAIRERNTSLAQAELKKLEQSLSADVRLREAAQILTASLDFKPGPAPVAAQGPICQLSEAQWQEARVGWGRPTVNHLPEDSPLLFVGGKLFARGLYAHAPSSYRYDLGGKWSKLTGHAGLADGHGGNGGVCDFGGRKGTVEIGQTGRWRSHPHCGGCQRRARTILGG
jgi:hypothetical protein